VPPSRKSKASTGNDLLIGFAHFFPELTKHAAYNNRAANAGANNIVSNMIIGPRIAGPDCENGALIGLEMLQWYSETALPVYNPKQPKQNTKIIQTTSESPLCHVSVGKWMKASGYALASPERKDRCARVAASVAYKLVVQDLNS